MKNTEKHLLNNKFKLGAKTFILKLWTFFKTVTLWARWALWYVLATAIILFQIFSHVHLVCITNETACLNLAYIAQFESIIIGLVIQLSFPFWCIQRKNEIISKVRFFFNKFNKVLKCDGPLFCYFFISLPTFHS